MRSPTRSVATVVVRLVGIGFDKYSTDAIRVKASIGKDGQG